MLQKVAFLVLVFLFSASAFAQTITREEAEQRAKTLLSQLSLDEKVGQLNQSPGVPMPMLGSQKPDDFIAKGEVGSILWLVDVKEINRLQHIAMEKSPHHIPILFAFDVIHGYRTVFPVPFWDPQSRQWVVEASTFDVWAGGDSTATLHADFSVTE